MTLNASVNGYQLPPETFSRPGTYQYSKELPAEVADTNMALARFCLDKALLPGPTEGRELGLVVMEIGLLAN